MRALGASSMAANSSVAQIGLHQDIFAILCATSARKTRSSMKAVAGKG
jgi:hypothetical protein